jgi:hypothetical protein
MPDREIKVIKRKDVPKQPRTPMHRFYFTFNDLKSAALQIAREIEREDGQATAPDVLRFINAVNTKII